MLKINQKKVCGILDKIIAHELAGVVRYSHYSFMLRGLSRISLMGYFTNHATESLTHAHKAGELLAGLEGHPSLKVEGVEETNHHELFNIIDESLIHEARASELYYELLLEVRDQSIYLEEYARGMIAQEEMHMLEMRKFKELS